MPSRTEGAVQKSFDGCGLVGPRSTDLDHENPGKPCRITS